MNLVLSDSASLSFNPFTLHVQIDDLALIDEHQVTQLSLKHAHVNISWLAFFSKEIVIEMAEVKALHMKVLRNNSELMVAGFDLSAKETSTKPAQDEFVDENNNLSTTLAGWTFKLPLFSVDDLALSVNDMTHQHHIALNQFSLRDVEATTSTFKSHVEVVAAINNASLKVDSKVNATLASLQLKSASLNNSLELSNFSLQDWQYLMPLADSEINELAAYIDLEIAHEIILEDKSWRVEQPNLRAVLNDINVVKPELTLMNKSIEFELNQLLVAGLDSQLTTASGEVSLVINGVNVSADDKTMAVLGRFELPAATFDVDSEFNATAHIEQIALTDVLFSKPSDDSAALYQNDALTIHNISWKNNHLAVDKVALDKFSSHVVLSADKQLKNLVLPASKGVVDAPQSEHVAPEATDSKESPSVTISLNTFELTNPSVVTFKDESVTPVFEHEITLNTASVTSVDSRDVAIMSPFDVALAFDKHARTTIKGAIAPFGEKLNLNVDLQMSEFSLPPLSAYLRTVLGFDFLSGQLDNKVTLAIKGDELDGETTIDLRGFELASGNDTTDLSANDGTAIGLNSALNMLKDGQGNVSLTVPLSGNINSPSFGVSSVLTLVAQKAIMSQAKSYLINTFVPYANIVTVASIAGEYLLRLEMNDLNYDAGQVVISPNQQQFVSELGALLTDKPKQQVKMCAVASMSEADVIAKAEPPEAQIALLKTLSKERGDTLKILLIEQFGIESSRLLLCAPKVDSDAKTFPRIEFSF